LTGEDDDVPVMDDFNRKKRIFTIEELKAFTIKSLDNYYEMFEEGNNEFENYKTLNVTKPPELRVFSLNGT
jgi:hypothetical protein